MPASKRAKKCPNGSRRNKSGACHKKSARRSRCRNGTARAADGSCMRRAARVPGTPRCSRGSRRGPDGKTCFRFPYKATSPPPRARAPRPSPSPKSSSAPRPSPSPKSSSPPRAHAPSPKSPPPPAAHAPRPSSASSSADYTSKMGMPVLDKAMCCQGSPKSGSSREAALSTLCFPKNAKPTPAEIKKNYHKCSLQVHPDKSHTQDTVPFFQNIGAAKSFLIPE